MKVDTYLLLHCFCTALFAQDVQKKVLIVGIDGCRPDALAVANTPTIDSWQATGIFSPNALNDDITISGPGWSAILCGVQSDKHLVTNNDFSSNNNNYEEFPSLFGLIEGSLPSLHSLSICHWAPINEFIIGDDADFKLDTGTDAEVSELASSYLAVNDPDLVFLHFDDPDLFGHRVGFSPEVSEYVAAIEEVDRHLATIWTTIQQRPTYVTEDWLVVVTTDHGGIGRSHGGNSIEEREVFMLVTNANTPQEIITKDTMLIIDSVDNCLGDAEELVFDGDNDRVNIPANDIFNFGTERDFTVECRVRTNTAGDFAIVGNKDWDSGVNPGFIFSFKFPAGPEWKINLGDGTNRADINTGGAIADDSWHTLSATFDRDGWMKMYQDGILLDSADISNIGNIDTGSPLTFGTDPFSDFDYQGSIAEVRIWDTVLDDDVIADWQCISLNEQHPNYDNLLGYWPLNDGNEVVEVADLSTYNNTGQISEATWRTTDTLLVDDYSDTPRLVDVVPTVLHHLCIPIDENWQLVGTSLIPACTLTNTTEHTIGTNSLSMVLFPNPVREELSVKIGRSPTEEPATLYLYDALGHKLDEQEVDSPYTQLAMQAYPAGIYIVVLAGVQQQISRRIIKH